MLQEPLRFIQINPGLHDPRRERMAMIVEMQVMDLCDIKRNDQGSPNGIRAHANEGREFFDRQIRCFHAPSLVRRFFHSTPEIPLWELGR